MNIYVLWCPFCELSKEITIFDDRFNGCIKLHTECLCPVCESRNISVQMCVDFLSKDESKNSV